MSERQKQIEREIEDIIEQTLNIFHENAFLNTCWEADIALEKDVNITDSLILKDPFDK
ncbi:hypothetical protein [Cytobacillus sp. IB215316]|uniref:hypothetical protein n=1 Tax=Cytobacillus sp. IB215316 TaxID=3097354 RepID=UPI002A0D8E0C|nr:hypothetical protein [Cytobacillus sp. IB215316]MDX8360333.1 hypothetical protein [Cytobacillus sp. IB215316]